MIQDDRALCASETLLQIQTNFNGMNSVKLTTEGQEAINITCSQKDS